MPEKKGTRNPEGLQVPSVASQTQLLEGAGREDGSRAIGHCESIADCHRRNGATIEGRQQEVSTPVRVDSRGTDRRAIQIKGDGLPGG